MYPGKYAQQFADRPAFIMASSGEAVSYAELEARSNRLAHVLRQHHGFAKGERVALLVHNRMEVVEVLVGTAKAAMVYVGLNFRMTETELASVLSNAEPRLLITEPEFEAMARRLAAESVVKNGLPVPAAKITTRPFSRWRTARRRM